MVVGPLETTVLGGLGREALTGKEAGFSWSPRGHVWAGLAQGLAEGGSVPSSGAQTLGPGAGQRAAYPRQVTSSDWAAGGALAAPRPLGRPRLPADSCVCSGMWKILQWGAFSLKPASEVAPWDFRSTSPQGPTHLAEPPAGRQSGSLFCSGEKGQGGPGWGQSEAQAWLRVGLALELVPDSGMRRTLSSDWPSVTLSRPKRGKDPSRLPVHWLQNAGTGVSCWAVGRKPNLKGS